MKHLIKAIRKEHKTNLEKNLKQIETKEGLNTSLRWNNKTYKGKIKEKLSKHLINKSNKSLAEDLAQVDKISKAQDLPNPFIITLEWKKSYMWGMNPRAHTNYGFEGSSIGGCGYCKTSTATAEALNSYDYIIKLLYFKEEKRLNFNDQQTKKNKIFKTKEHKIKERREFLGYGSGHSILPSFCGGVGVNSHQNIIEKIGLKWMNVSSTKHTDVYMITK